MKLLQEFELFFGRTDGRTEEEEGQTDVEVEIVIYIYIYMYLKMKIYQKQTLGPVFQST